MTGADILCIYVTLFALEVSFSTLLDYLNIRNVEKNSDSIPKVFKDAFDKETYQKSVKYTLRKAKFGIFASLVSSVFLIGLILSGSLGGIDLWLETWSQNFYLRGLLYFWVISLVFYLFGLPFSLYSTFVIEEEFGFNNSTFTTWLADQAKGLVLSALITTPILIALFWFMNSSGSYWWLYAFCFIAVMQLLLMYIYPNFIAPFFNKFEPMPEGETRTNIECLAQNAGFKTEGIYVMDGSKRSKHANAYFTGFGKHKRIVLFDTLIDSLKLSELLAVLAHEIGHEKLNHIKKSLMLSLILMLLSFWIMSLLIDYQPFYTAFGFKEKSYHAALIIFSFASGPITFWLSPLFSLLSRKHEYEADRFAVNTVRNNKDLGDALLALSRKSLSNLTPHPLYSFFHYSHPTLHERLLAMQNIKVEV